MLHCVESCLWLLVPEVYFFKPEGTESKSELKCEGFCSTSDGEEVTLCKHTPPRGHPLQTHAT